MIADAVPLEDTLVAFVTSARTPAHVATPLRTALTLAGTARPSADTPVARAAAAVAASGTGGRVLISGIAACVVAVAEDDRGEEHGLDALCVGAEVGIRVARALGGSVLDGTYAGVVLGGAMACARALGLDAATTLSALAFAATQAGALAPPDRSGPDSRDEWAAVCAVESALVAAHGLVGPPRPLSGRHGLLPLLRVPTAGAEVLHGLGSVWVVADRVAGPGTRLDTSEGSGS